MCSAGKVKQATKPAAGKGVFLVRKKNPAFFLRLVHIPSADDPVGHMFLSGGDGSSAGILQLQLFGAQTSASMGNIGAK